MENGLFHFPLSIPHFPFPIHSVKSIPQQLVLFLAHLLQAIESLFKLMVEILIDQWSH